MNNILREKISEGINFTYIPEEKFKTTVVSFSMFTPLSKSEVSKMLCCRTFFHTAAKNTQI